MVAKTLSTAGIPAVKSTTIWGGFVLFLTGITQLFTDPTVLAVLPAHLLPVVTVIGSALTIYGRVSAQHQITSVVSSTPPSDADTTSAE